MYISAGNTIQNKFSPDFMFTELGQGQLLTWDQYKKAFTNVNLVDLDFETPNGVDDIKVFEAIGSGTQSLYSVPWHAVSAESLIITINGIKQQDAAYSIQSYDAYTDVQFTGNIPTGKTLEIIGLIVEDESSIKFMSTTGTGAILTPIITWVAPGKESLFITINGVKQQQAAYDIAVVGQSTQLTFNGVPDIGDIIEIVGITGNFGTTNYGVETVLGANLGTIGHNIFESESVAGKETTLNFRSMRQGHGIDITSDGVSILVTRATEKVTNNANSLYTFIIADEVKVMENTVPMTCSIPHSTTLDFPIGHKIEIIQTAELLTFASDIGVTITSLNNSLETAGIGSVVYLRKISTDGWVLSGNILQQQGA